MQRSGEPFTQYRQESAQSTQRIATLKGDHLDITVAKKSKIDGVANPKHNQTWISVANTVEITQPQALEEDAGNGPHTTTLTTEYIPLGQPWRPTPKAKPVIDGPQMAKVVGPPGEEIYCDQWGRIKIQFPWDRYGKSNDRSSCWVRVSQNWAGGQFGHMAVPRIGHEVIVDFLEGDPDQPIVTGRTYHVVNQPPYKLPINKTRMTIKSKTHKGEGFNELRFEDQNGQQEVFIHAEKDQNNVVKNDETTKVGHDRTEDIGNNETIAIGVDRKETVGNDENVAIGNNQVLTVGGNQTETVGNNANTTIGGNQVGLVQGNKAETIAIAKALSVGAAYQVRVGAAKNETVGLSSTEQVGIMKHILAGKRFELVVGSSSLILNSDGTIILKGKDILIDSGTQTTVKGKMVEIS